MFTQHTRSPHECVSDLENLQLLACVQLTRRLLTSVSTLPPGAERSRVILKIVVLFVAAYGIAA